MKMLKTVFLASMCTICFTYVNAQTTGESNSVNTESTSEEFGIPESYQQSQDQLNSDYSAGNATYNIDDNEMNSDSDIYSDSGSASWRSDESVEVLRVYSGSQDGNNLVKKIEVKVPESVQGSSW